MAITHRLESAHFPYLPLQVSIGSRSVEAEALLDTGFDGDLALPASPLTDSERPDEYVTWALADGSEVGPAFLGTVRLGNLGPFPVVITVIGDQPLAGRGVSDRFFVSLNHGRRIIVEA